MKLLLSKAARDFLETLRPKQFRQVVTTIFRLLSEPYPHDSKQLKGYPYHRVDIGGEYRAVYEVEGEGDALQVLLVGKRNDDEVYRLLNRVNHPGLIPLRGRTEAGACGRSLP
ncbi:MAG: type II toxin-antitoxin system RelE/ParE family toxin, partial [Thermaerobacter sp.]|nr:type II toxin-antitoxin system RelE/ParE family toxin [Thermaerobacter sp.]